MPSYSNSHSYATQARRLYDVGNARTLMELMAKHQATEQEVMDALEAAQEFKQFLGSQACVDHLIARLLSTHTEVMKFPCIKSK